jgi:biotin transporter BioY
MYIIAIAWLYVTVLMAATEKSITSGLLTFVFYGLLPCALLLWILGTKHRRFKKSNTQANETTSRNDDVRQPNSGHSETNE